jgi:preprotein translocase subunit SecY
MTNRKIGFQELKSRILFVILGIMIFRFGVYIPIPYINTDELNRLILSHNSGDNSFLHMFNMFSGGALEKLSIFALGIMPYISTSIVVQMLTSASPKFISLRKDGEAGKKKISQYTRYFTFLFAIFQSFAVALYTLSQENLVSINSVFMFYTFAIMSMTTGSMFLMWLGEQMTERGIGNGISLLIFSGIVVNLPFEITTAIEQANRGLISYFFILLFFVIMLCIIAFVIFVERAQRRITVNYAKRQHGRKVFAPQSSHLPLKLNMSGVIPPIFASSILMVPGMLSNWFSSSCHTLKILGSVLQPGSLAHSIIFSVSIIFFCFFYTSLVFNSKETSENLKKSGAFITGVRPGEQTAKYIDSIIKKLTMVGSIYITTICLSPIFILKIIGQNASFTFSGVSLLIVVVIIMDFISQVQSYVMSTKYDSLLKKSNFVDYNK